MSDRPLSRSVDKCCAWYKMLRSWNLLQLLVFAGCAVATLCIAADKLLFLRLDYMLIAAALGAATLLVMLTFQFAARKKKLYVTYLVDRNSGLKNLVSSGVYVVNDGNEVSDAVVRRAEKALKGRRPAKIMPLKLTWTGRHMYIPLGLLLVAIFIPQLDLLARKEKLAKMEEEAELVEEGMLKLAAKMSLIESNIQTTAEIDGVEITKDFQTLAKNMQGMGKQEALMKLGEFESKYNKDFAAQRDFEKMTQALETQPDMRGLTDKSQDALNKLLEEMKEGNLSEAAEALQDLAEQMQDPNASEEEKKALAREMQKLAEQMQGGANSEELSQLMQQVQSSDMSAEELAQKCQCAAEAMSQMANTLEDFEALQAMSEGLAEAKEAMLGESFSDFDEQAVEQYMASQGGGLGSLGEDGEGDGEGSGTGEDGGTGTGGTGGEGQGKGGQPLENRTATAFQDEFSDSKISKGTVLNQLFVKGVPEKGEGVSEYADVARAAKQHAASSLAQDKIPREYEDMVKEYFDTIDPAADSE